MNVLYTYNAKATNHMNAQNGQSTSDEVSRPSWTYLLLFGLLFLGIGAIYGGGSLVLDPTGRRLGIPFEWIQGSVFGSYLIPGAFLFCFLGIGSFVVFSGIVRRAIWAWSAGIGLGLATIVWISVQFVVIEHYFFLQPVIAGLGGLIVVLLLLPSMRHHYRVDNVSARSDDVQ